MKPLIVVCLVLLSCGYSTSYPVFGIKRYHRANPTYSQSPQYYDTNTNNNNNNYQQQYLSPYPQQQVQRISDYYYNPREYHYYGMPTYHGEYNKPQRYYYAHPSYSYSDDQVQSNPLDDLHEEILQENERERTRDMMPIMADNWYDNTPQIRQQQQPQQQQLQPDNNDYTNAAFMRNLVMYNKQLDRMHNNNQQQDLQNINDNVNEFGDYEESPDNAEWYDVAATLNMNNNLNSGIQQRTQSNTYQQPLAKINSDYDDEVKQLKELKSHRYESPSSPQSQPQMGLNPYDQNRYDSPSFVSQNQNWQSDMGDYNSYDTSDEPEYDDSNWINWERKRDIQPKKDFGIFGLTEVNVNNNNDNKKPTTTTTSSHVINNNKFEKVQPTRAPEKQDASTTISNDLPTKTHKGGQKEVVLPRPATPVRKPFTDPVMKMLEAQAASKSKKSSGQPIFDTIKQIIDMEQNLNHLIDNQLPTSKIQKRFVTNEEALVQQLHGLKRTFK